jgi:3-oxoacyl-[acyl-carrier protein] reductase
MTSRPGRTPPVWFFVGGCVPVEGLRGKVAVVTGASRTQGIGAAICRELAGHGVRVFFTQWVAADIANGYDIGGGPQALLRELQSFGPAATMELVAHGAATRLLDAAEAAVGRPSILVNNATHCTPTSVHAITEAVVDAHAAVNVRGTLTLSAEFARRSVDLGWGRIVSLVSGQDHSGERGNLAYGATKGAISAMTRYLALETASYGITVNAVDPGPTDTGWMDDALRAEVLAGEPMGRLGRPEDAALLCSDHAALITGQVTVSDGGFSLA